MFFTYLRRELRRRIIGQVMSEAVALGVVGGAGAVGAGAAGAKVAAPAGIPGPAPSAAPRRPAHGGGTPVRRGERQPAQRGNPGLWGRSRA